MCIFTFRFTRLWVDIDRRHAIRPWILKRVDASSWVHSIYTLWRHISCGRKGQRKQPCIFTSNPWSSCWFTLLWLQPRGNRTSRLINSFDVCLLCFTHIDLSAISDSISTLPSSKRSSWWGKRVFWWILRWEIDERKSSKRMENSS